MADDLTPGDIRARKFGGSRRGYDRAEVAAYLARVADRIGSLESEMSAITQRLGQLGITDLPDLKSEIDHLGAEVQTVLSAAMEAAEGLRTRAYTDASDVITDADAASQAARGDAWEAGTDLLRHADGAGDRMISEAREDALFIRAEAEQDAKRLITDARRQADDMVRSSRDDGERIVVVAKAESEAILEGARQSADKAQERARALENRRSELLGELEAAQSAIREIEEAQTREEAEPDVGIRVISSTSGEQTRWPQDDGAVRILPAVEPPSPQDVQTVDADAMAAEVAELRSAVTMPQSIDETEAEVVADEDSAVANEDVADPIGDEPIPEIEEVDEPESPPPEPVETAAAVAEPPAEPTEPEPAVEDKVTVVADDPGIEALFAKLRRPSVEPVPEAVEITRNEAADESAATEPPVLQVVPPAPVAGGFERRDRMLLPIENRGLRGLKRRIVELQNRVLEELRTSDGQWRLGREFVVEMMGDELDAVLQDSFVAGHAAAAESVDAVEPQVTGGPEQGAAETFTVDLHRDVQTVIERDAGGASRRLTSDVGRVFRSWRTDEAERHVRLAARRAFNDGLLAGYKRLGVETVEVAAPGRPCGECGADSGVTWRPGDELPEAIAIPPAGPTCAAMIVPAGSDGFDSRPGQ